MLLLTAPGRLTGWVGRNTSCSQPFAQKFGWLQLWPLGLCDIGRSGLKFTADGSCSFGRQSIMVGDILLGSNSLKRQRKICLNGICARLKETYRTQRLEAMHGLCWVLLWMKQL